MKKWRYIKVHPNKNVKVDAEDLNRINLHSWRITKGTTGRLRVVTTIRTPKGPRHLTLGKFLMNPPKGKQVYPRRFNEELDYRKSNLAICSLKERQRLLPKNRIRATSKYKGVSFISKTKRWRAGIEIKGVAINLGEYKNEEDAGRAYNKAAKKYFGTSTYQNQIIKRANRRKP